MKKSLLHASSLLLSVLLLTGCTTAQPHVTSQQPEPEQTEATPPSDSESLVPAHENESIEQNDDRGIDGMTANQIILTYESAFGLPYNKEKSSNQEYCAYTCVSSCRGDGVIYDYSISLDADNEIIGATIGITAETASPAQLLSACDLYFYVIAIAKYDTADKDTLVAWFEESLPNASGTPLSITVGDATFELYAMEDTMYWVDIYKAV